MSPVVIDEQVESYRRDGVVLLRKLIDADMLRVLACGVEQNLAKPTRRTTNLVDDPSSSKRFFYDACVLGEVGAYDRLMLESPMAEAVARLMGSSCSIVFYISVFVRAAGMRNRTPWHQDQPSWSAEGSQACSAWVSLDPVPRETALEFVRGSHRWQSELQRPEFFNNPYERDDRSKRPPFPDIQAHREEYEILG